MTRGSQKNRRHSSPTRKRSAEENHLARPVGRPTCQQRPRGAGTSAVSTAGPNRLVIVKRSLKSAQSYCAACLVGGCVHPSARQVRFTRQRSVSQRLGSLLRCCPVKVVIIPLLMQPGGSVTYAVTPPLPARCGHLHWKQAVLNNLPAHTGGAAIPRTSALKQLLFLLLQPVPHKARHACCFLEEAKTTGLEKLPQHSGK